MILVARLLTLLLFAAPPAFAAAQPDVPGFEDFPAPATRVPSHVAVRIATAKDGEFRTRLQDGARQPPDFAGHYKLSLWSCGASCVMGAAIDARTGRVTWLPFTVCCAPVGVEPLTYRRDSRLLVVRGSRNEAGGGTYYYTLGESGFTLLQANEAK